MTSAVYQALIRPVLFRLGRGDPETAHRATLRVLSRLAGSPRAIRAVARMFGADPVGSERTVFGIRFPNAVGLAAGMDKDAAALPAWRALGFGFAEVGTVTGQAQPGNPAPRLLRLPESRALLNRMGFNNAGAQAMADRLRGWQPLDFPVGVSIGRSKKTLAAAAAGDYLDCLRLVYPYADYLAINVSSPNTTGLRALQGAAELAELVAALQQTSAELAAAGLARIRHRAGKLLAEAPTPLLIKVAPDLDRAAISALLEVCREQRVAGLIATNTTTSRAGLGAADADRARAFGAGGLSGAPLRDRALDTVRFVSSETAGELPVIGVGGIMDPDDASRMLDAGADLVQLYSGLIYTGPRLVRAIKAALSGELAGGAEVRGVEARPRS